MNKDGQQIDPRLAAIKDCLYRLSAKAVIIEDQKLLMTLEHGGDWWSLPGGGVDYGETVRESLARELAEELGLSPEYVDVDEAPLLATTHAVVDNIPRAVLYFRTSIRVRMAGRSPDHPLEVKRYAWYAAEDLQSIKMSPSIGKITGKLVELLG